jgi:hypothetical protein
MRIPDIKYSIAAATACSLLAACAGGSSTPAAALGSQPNQARRVKSEVTCHCLYVTNFGGNSVAVYPVNSSGNAAPSQYIVGPNTDLDNPAAVAVDSSGNIYVANYGNDSVSVYAAGATGSVTPSAVINGAYTGLNHPSGVAIDPINGDIYVENYAGGGTTGGSVTFYPPGADGNVAPLGTIAGSSTQLDTSFGLTLDANGNIYVPNADDLITVYPAGSTGNVPPSTAISGSDTKLIEPFAVGLDSSSNLYVANEDSTSSSVTAYPAGANGNVPPSQGYIVGKKTKLDSATGLALASNDKIYVSNYSSNTITVYPAGSTGDVKPSVKLKGKRTMLNEPVGLTIH